MNSKNTAINTEKTKMHLADKKQTGKIELDTLDILWRRSDGFVDFCSEIVSWSQRLAPRTIRLFIENHVAQDKRIALMASVQARWAEAKVYHGIPDWEKPTGGVSRRLQCCGRSDAFPTLRGAFLFPCRGAALGGLHGCSMKTRRDLVIRNFLEGYSHPHCFSCPFYKEYEASEELGISVVAATYDAHSLFLGSPGLILLDETLYLISYDWHIRGVARDHQLCTAISLSHDRGQTWIPTAFIEGIHFASPVLIGDEVYLFGCDFYGNLLACRSADRGRNWSAFKTLSAATPERQWRCSPMAVVFDGKKIRFVLEAHLPPFKWGEEFRPTVAMASIADDLLEPASWSFSNSIPFDFRAPGLSWLEGSILRDKIILRRHCNGYDTGSLLDYDPTGNRISVPDDHAIAMPGGCTKFDVKFDGKTKLYWAVVNPVERPVGFRNRLALAVSRDLRHWEIRSVIAQHWDAMRYGFHYASWQFDGDDLVLAGRLAWNTTRNGHDSSHIVFKRVGNFRCLTREDDVLHYDPKELESGCYETDDYRIDYTFIAGTPLEFRPFRDGQHPFLDKDDYVLNGIPPEFQDYVMIAPKFQQVLYIVFTAKKHMVFHLAKSPLPNNEGVEYWMPREQKAKLIGPFISTKNGSSNDKTHEYAVELFHKVFQAGESIEIQHTLSRNELNFETLLVRLPSREASEPG